MANIDISRRNTLLALGNAALLTACGGGGGSAGQPSPLPVITEFKADSTGISKGNQNTLKWTVSGATSISIDQGIGTVTGSQLSIAFNTEGTRIYTLTATNSYGSATAQVRISVWSAAAGISADRPVLQGENNGAYGQPWGAAGMQWPKQLFWGNVGQISSKLYEMRLSAEGEEKSGRAPVLGCVAWGFEYEAALGSSTVADNSQEGGWKEWGIWMKNHPKYFSTNWNGVVEQGYITPMMPMDAADWPVEWTAPSGWVAPSGWIDNKPVTTISYAQWIGVRLAQVAWHTGSRGLMCADYVVDLEWGDAIDYNPRIIDDFAAWAGVTVPAGDVPTRADYVQNNYKSLWWDYKCTRFAEFYGSFGRSMLANGKVPQVGGQTFILHKRGAGLDPRIQTQSSSGLPGKYWFFNVEMQADSLRPPKPYWVSGIGMGATAAREPDMRFGAHMDAVGGQGEYGRSVSNAGKSAEWGDKHITQQWLSVGWAHHVTRAGKVERAVMYFLRSYWDAGATPVPEMTLILEHIPRHPFGPAFYYSVAIERSFETGNGKYGNSSWICLDKLNREILPVKPGSRSGNARGLCLGYYVSDVGIDHLAAADRPSAWIVYDSDRLPAAEKTKLQAMAPIYDIDAGRTDASGTKAKELLDIGPIHFAQESDQCINGLAFVDQNDSVIVMISNTLETAGTATMVFSNVSNGSFTCKGLLGATDVSLAISNKTGSVPIKLAARETIVYEIPGLKWINPGLIQ